MTSGNHNAETDDTDKRRPIIITDCYNKTKGGVDLLDQQIEEYTVRRKTNRWPLLLFFDCLDIGCYNSFIIMRKSSPSYERKTFLKDLAFELAKPFAEKRLQKLRNTTLHAHIRQAASLVGYHVPAEPGPVIRSRPTSGRCSCKRKTRSFCDSCSKPICPAHRMTSKRTVCLSCD